MSVTIKNWKLLALALLLIALFISLGFWQLSRAKEKEKLLAAFENRKTLQSLTANQLKTIGLQSKDLRFFRATLTGQFDNSHTFLLDNKIVNGRVGYEVYTPFYASGLDQAILVDRGFVPASANRQILPDIAKVQETVTLTGIINSPPKYVAFGQIQESAKPSWPLRIEYVNLEEMSHLFNQEANLVHSPLFFNYLLLLEAGHPAAFEVKWQIVTIDPSRHRGYALQWFAFALTLVVLSVALNRA